MNQRIVISLGVFVVGFGLGYGATYMLVGSSSGDETGETASPTASIDSGAAVTDAGAKETSKADETPKDNPSEATSPVLAKDDVEPPKKKVANPVAEPAAVEVKKPWWEVCLGKKCAVDFGGIKSGLSIRRGKIEHKQKVDWNLRFKKAQRLNILPTDRRVKVELVAVGFDGKGKPAVAQVKWSDKGQAVSGVVSLQPGDKQVRLLPNTAE